MTIPKNRVCLWFDKDAEEAATFYTSVFPDSSVSAVHRAPGAYPGGASRARCFSWSSQSSGRRASG